MANEEKKVMSTDSTIRELQQVVDALPRTDHMTLPAIQITEIDEETQARMQAIADINNAKSDKEKIGDKTVGQIKNQFAYGVSDMDEEAGKHEIIVKEGREGTRSVTIIPPVIIGVDENGKEHEIQSDKLVIEPTPANIAPVDADAPKNPVEGREAAEETQAVEEPVARPIVPATPTIPNATPSSSAQVPPVNTNSENK